MQLYYYRLYVAGCGSHLTGLGDSLATILSDLSPQKKKKSLIRILI